MLAPQTYTDAGKVYRYDASATDPAQKIVDITGKAGTPDASTVQSKAAFDAGMKGPDAGPGAPPQPNNDNAPIDKNGLFTYGQPGGAKPDSSQPASPVSRYSDMGALYAPGGAKSTMAVTAEDEQAIRDKARGEVQGSIDAINQAAEGELATARAAGLDRLGQARALNASTGELGNPSGGAKIDKTTALNAAGEKAILDARDEKVATILSGVNTRADALVQNAKTAADKNSTDYAAFLKTSADSAKADMQSLAAAGVELNPDQKQKLLQQTGLDPKTFDQIYSSQVLAAKSKNFVNLDKPIISGDGKTATFIEQVKDPTTGQVSFVSHNADLPAGVDPKNIDIVSRADGLYAINKVQNADGSFTTHRLAGPESAGGNVDQSLAGLPKGFQQAAASGKTGQDLLGSLATVDQATVKSILDYTKNPANLSLRKAAGETASEREKFLAMAHAIDPSYDESQYGARSTYNKSLQSGQIYQGLQAAGKSINHLTSLLDAMGKLHNTGFDVGIPFTGITVNSVKADALKTYDADTQQAVKTAQVEANGVGQEMAKFFKGTGVSDVNSIEEWNKNLSIYSTPGAQEGLKNGALTLLTGQLDEVYNAYRNTMGRDPDHPLVSQEALDKLKTLGVDVAPYEGTASQGSAPSGGDVQSRAAAAGYDYAGMKAAGYDDAAISDALDKAAAK